MSQFTIAGRRLGNDLQVAALAGRFEDLRLFGAVADRNSTQAHLNLGLTEAPVCLDNIATGAR